LTGEEDQQNIQLLNKLIERNRSRSKNIFVVLRFSRTLFGGTPVPTENRANYFSSVACVLRYLNETQWDLPISHFDKIIKYARDKTTIGKSRAHFLHFVFEL